MKKFLFLFFLFGVNYLLICTALFFFSYISLINGKVYSWLFINEIQKSIYFRGGLRNIWQQQKECVSFDKDLLYIPKIGSCTFENAEFKTILNFKKEFRSNGPTKILADKKDNNIVVLGDSLAMGWGVNDHETYSSILERKTSRKVYNQGVSSYGTIRQVKRLINSETYNNINTIVIHYHYNDFIENNELKINKVYNTKKYDKIFEKNNVGIFWLLRQLKRSFRTVYNEFKNVSFNRKKNFINLDLEKHMKIVEKIIVENLDFTKKKIIILFIEESNMLISNFPKKSKNENVDYLILKLNKDSFYIVDDHLNQLGHKIVADKIIEKLK